MGLSMGLLEVSILMVGVERKSDTTNKRTKKTDDSSSNARLDYL